VSVQLFSESHADAQNSVDRRDVVLTSRTEEGQMNRLACLFTGGLTLLAVACSSGSSQSVVAPTPVAAPIVIPSPAATPTPVTGIVVTTPTKLRAGVPAVFTFTVTGMPLIDLTLAWGDETMTDVGALTQGTVSHVYASAGAYTLTVTVTTNAGGGKAIASGGPLIVN
jgi:hypothetical protein